ncbi:GH92 family glycosyl hydrolase [Amphibacillus sp. Q70]|uniref:GH92 family glycosyl hydrolase n=1 Tax=Amphibacillus sp. Q70 TaxID=3453416 RepID=UPI003F855AFC
MKGENNGIERERIMGVINKLCKKRMIILLGMITIFTLTAIYTEAEAKGSEIEAEDYTAYVDPFVGTAVDHGQQFPGAVVPYGLVKLSPDTYPRENIDHAGYDYNKNQIQGFSHTRIEGVGGQGSGGDVLVTPTYMKYTERPSADSKAQTYSNDNEHATPGNYQVELIPVAGEDDDFQEDASKGTIAVDLATDVRTGYHSYTFPEAGEASIIVDTHYTYDGMDVRNARMEVEEQDEKTTIKGRISGNNVSGHGTYTLYYYMETEVPAKQIQTWNGNSFDEDFSLAGDDLGAILTFDVKADQQIDLKVSISPISSEQAKIDMEQEVPDWDIEEVKTNAKDAWNEILGKIKVDTSEQSDPDGTKKQLFYTSLYRMFTLPVNATSTSGTYMGTDGNVYEAEGFVHYDSWTLWDDFRKYPTIGMVAPDIYQDIIQSIANMLVTGIETWGSDHQSVMTVRNEHAVALLADGIAKGFTDIDGLEEAYEAAKEIADKQVTESVVERGYFTGRVDKTVEYAYDDWALSIIAEELGKEEEASYYLERSFHYMNLYKDDAVETEEGETMGLLWPKNENGNWMSADPERFGDNGLYQGTLWQYTWWDSNDVGGLTELLGGKEELQKSLSYLYGEHDPDNGYAMLSHHTNEIDLHSPYLFNYAGKPSRTQYWVRNLYTKQTWNRYSGDGEYNPPIYDYLYKLAPEGFLETMDEDGGTMSAMYVTAALGIFPMTPGDTSYQIGTPFFEHVSLDLGNGKTFDVYAKDVSDENFYIQSATLNGESYNQSWIDYQQILDGGTLSFEMGDESSDWAEDGVVATSSSDTAATAMYEDDEIKLSSKTFIESAENDGRIENTIDITLTEASFNQADGTDFVEAGLVEAENVPEGLSIKAEKLNEKTVQLSFDGKAKQHDNKDSVEDVLIEFTDQAFEQQVDSKRKTSMFRIVFDNPTLTYDKKIIAESGQDDGSIEDTILITLTDDTFTGKPGEKFEDTGKVAFLGTPKGLHPSVEMKSDTELELSFSGKAEEHQTPVKHFGIRFEDAAFTSENADHISNSIQSGLQSFVLNFNYDWSEKLASALGEAKQIEGTNYTKTSYGNLQLTIEDGEQLLNHSELPNDGRLRSAYVSLQTAILKLKAPQDSMLRLYGSSSDRMSQEEGINGPLKVEGTAIANTFDGAWIAYDDLDFDGMKVNGLTINYALNESRSAADGKLYVYADKMDEEHLITEIELEPTSSSNWHTYQSKEIEIEDASLLADGEKHDIYILMKGSTSSSHPYILNFKYMQFEGGESAVEVESIEIDTEALMILKQGETIQPNVIITPENAEDKSISWQVQKEDIAEISDDGTITAKKTGTTKITATTSNQKQASFVLRVTK